MYKKFLPVLVILACFLLTACDMQVTVNDMPVEEYYLSNEYPNYTIVKTAELGEHKAFLLQGEEDYNLAHFIDGKYVGGTNGFTTLYGHVCGDEKMSLVIIAGPNLGCEHSNYSITFRDNPSMGNDYSAMVLADKENWNQTVITRDVSQQELILDIYVMPTYYSIDLQQNHWDDGSIF